jgi:hypothetical protein
VVTDVYEHKDRLRSYELVAEVAKEIASRKETELKNELLAPASNGLRSLR